MLLDCGGKPKYSENTQRTCKLNSAEPLCYSWQLINRQNNWQTYQYWKQTLASLQFKLYGLTNWGAQVVETSWKKQTKLEFHLGQNYYIQWQDWQLEFEPDKYKHMYNLRLKVISWWLILGKGPFKLWSFDLPPYGIGQAVGWAWQGDTCWGKLKSCYWISRIYN